RFLVLGLALVGFGHRQQFLGADLALGRLRQLDDVVDHLLLKDRRPQIAGGLGVVAVVIEHLTLRARKALGFPDQGLVELVLSDADIGIAADFGKQEPEAYAPFRQALVFSLEFFVFLARGGGLRGRCRRRFGSGFLLGRLARCLRRRIGLFSFVLAPDV